MRHHTTGVDVRRSALSFVLAAGVVAGVMLPIDAGADVDSYPPTIEPIVTGDVTAYQWMLPAVNAAEAHTEATGAGVTVAVIDTGVDATHPDLEGHVVPGATVVENETTGKPELIPASVEDTSDDWYGHGSHVAGIVAADDDGNGVTGIAPEASIMPIDMYTEQVRMNDVKFWGMVAAGIDYSVSQGADVINMSLGGISSGIAPSDDTQKYLDALETLCTAVDNATAAGTVVVASAGNSGSWGNPEMKPGACPGAVTVAALAPSLDRTVWSSYDASVDLAAPGEDVLSVDSTAAENSPTPHLIASGTSMASPVVAGVAALVVEQHPGWDAQQVIDQLTSTAKDLGVTGRDPDTGFGIVDAAAAVGAAAPNPKRQNYFGTWFDGMWDGERDHVIVGWTTPDADPVTGYTVTVHTLGSAAHYDVDGLTVRQEVILPRGAWWTVTAHTTSGDVSTYPRYRYARQTGDSPQRLTGVKHHRDGDTLVISWDKPDDPTTVDKIKAYVWTRGDGGGRGVLKIDQAEPFPKQMTVELTRATRWSDAFIYLVLYNKDEDGETIGANGFRLHRPSPALYGSHVDAVVGAGRRHVEVTGALSPLNAKRVCGTWTCAGEPAVLVVDRGRHTERIDVIYTSKGRFHQVVDVEPGQKQLRVKIVGPKRLDSGPFVKEKILR